ncbi:MAG: MotA/TolQ/ExbB proton channel family protein [Prosthecobacter sp.]|uniref:MotA/TolQ/ExbB proton channel family protein n=1 Tax=Prosthecobacter sp. TaxID=1965333 RepID=UPI0025F633B7|nr:MotA/TolQ/ExbB proton channel family protein [Prosthecobacter sp.]MCF7786522.1 MotA/TolQ/ExbB proton channel family protein [Prosthecobacter sp.]
MKRTALTLAFIFTTGAALLAEEAPPAAKPGETPAIHTKTLWEQIKEGGWVMFPIGACSMLTLYLIGDGFIRVTSPKKMLPKEQVTAVKNLFRSGKYVDAYNYCKAQNSAFANVARMAISSLGEGKTAAEEAILTEMTKENSRIQTFVSYLSVIGVCTPMIGLLGTVTGMISAFAVLGSSGIGDPSGLSAAIGEVLVATASGLFIAIPAFSAYYWLRNRGVKALHEIQDTIAHMLRKMPYDKLAGAHIGDEEIVAADPDWWVADEQEALA